MYCKKLFNSFICYFCGLIVLSFVFSFKRSNIRHFFTRSLILASDKSLLILFLIASHAHTKQESKPAKAQLVQSTESVKSGHVASRNATLLEQKKAFLQLRKEFNSERIQFCATIRPRAD